MKKIFLLFIVLIIFIFILIFYLIDKVYINKYIKNLQEKLNINIILKEPHQLTIAPNISLLTKFNLENNDNNLFLEDGELIIQRNYNFKKPFFNFNSKNMKIENLVFDNLFVSGEINEYNYNNLLKVTLFPKGYLSFNLNNEDKKSLKLINIIIQRLNVPKPYKELSNLFFNHLNNKSFFNSKIIYENEYIYIHNLNISNNIYNIKLVGEYNWKKEFVNFQGIVNIKKEKIFEISALGNLGNPEIKVLSSDKSIDINFNINDINQILSGNFEDVFQNLITNE